MTDYTYTDEDGDYLAITGSLKEGSVIVEALNGAVRVPAEERPKLAQAIAGDEWQVVSARQAGEPGYPNWDGDFRVLGPGVIATADMDVINVHGQNYTRRPEPIDPAKVRIGDIVEVEADEGPWMVRGEVYGIVTADSSRPFSVHLGDDHLGDDVVIWPRVADCTTYVIHRPEPDPEPEQMALAQVIQDAFQAAGYVFGEDFDRELWDRNVRVVGGAEL